MAAETCAGCEFVVRQSAGKREDVEHVFFICSLGRGQAARPVFEYVRASVVMPTVPVPAWCRLNKTTSKNGQGAEEK